MSVAKSQTSELLSVISKYVKPLLLPALFKDLEQTQAFKRNASFRDTVIRLEGEYLKGGN